MRDGAVPDGWRMVTLGEISRVEIGRTPARNRREFWDPQKTTENRWVTIADMQSRFVSDTGEYISDLGARESGARLVPPGTPLMSFKLTVGRVSVPTVPVYTNEAIAAVYPGDGVAPDFLAYALPSAATGGPSDRAVKGLTLNMRKLRKLRLLLPPLPEQRKIAEILSSVDDTIERTEAVIEQVRRVKQGLAQQLLTRGLPGRHTRYQQTEVGEIPACWEVVRLGDCIKRGPANGVYRPLSDYGSGVPIVRIDDLEAGEFLRRDGFKRLRLPTEDVRRYELKPREVLINRVNSLPQLGKCALVPGLPEPAVYESNMMRLAPDEERLLPEYLVLWLCSPSAIRQIQARAKRAVAQASIDQDDVRTLLMPCPPVAEQARIVEVVGEVDGRLKHERATLRALRQAKQNLMHLLLTGQVRVRVPGSPAAEEQVG